ncbi:hypothetical protein Tco_1549533 [Tanacetum coccineum]
MTLLYLVKLRERIRSGGKDKRRHYIPTNAVTAHLLNKEKDDAKEYVSFENMINNQMNTSESKKKIERRKLFDSSRSLLSVNIMAYFQITFETNAEILDNEKNAITISTKRTFDSV